MTAIRKNAISVVVIVVLAAVLSLTGCASKASTTVTPGQADPTGIGSIAVPNPTAPADAAQNAADQMNNQTQQTQQGVQDADPNGLSIQQ